MSQSEEYRLDPKRKYRWRAQIAALSALIEAYRVDLGHLEVLHETEFWCASDQGARARATQWAGRQWKPPADAAAPADAGWHFLIPGAFDSHHFRVLPGALLLLRPVVEPVDAEAAAFMEQVRLGGDRALTGRSRTEVLRLLEAYFRQECDNQGGTLTDQLAEDADRAYDLPGAAEIVARAVNWQLTVLGTRLGQRLDLTCPACGHTGYGIVSRVPGGYEEGEFICDCGTPLQPQTPTWSTRGLFLSERHTYCPRCGPRRTDIAYCSPAGPTRERLPVPGEIVWLECQACHSHVPEPKARTTVEARAEWWTWFRAYRETHPIEYQPFTPDLHQLRLQAALRTAAAETRLIVLYAAPEADAVMDAVRTAATPGVRINTVDMPAYRPDYRRQGLARLFYQALRQGWGDQPTAALGKTMRAAAGVWVIDHADNLDYACLHALADPLALPIVVLIARRPALYDELARTDTMWRRAVFVTPAPVDVLPPESAASAPVPTDEAPFPAPGFRTPDEMPPITLGETYPDIVIEAVMDDDDDLAFNPAVTGLLPGSPAVMDEDTWIEAACDKINEYGARAFLRRMLDDLRQELGDEDVYGGEGEVDGETDEDTLFLSLTTHLLKKQVLGWHTPGAGFPFDALLVFVDGHALPIAWPEGADLPRPAQVNRLEGQYLVAVFFRENAEGEPYVVLCFHAEAEALAKSPAEWDWADVQGRGFVRVPTTAKTAGMIACPVTGEMGDEDLDQDMTAAEMVEEHLAGRRVADKLAGSEGTALIFDDAHMLPIMPAPGLEPVDAARLEDIVGRFLVLADQDSRDGGRLKLYFHDDPDRLNPVLESTARAPETYESLITAFLSEPATRLLVIATESAWHIVCPD